MNQVRIFALGGLDEDGKNMYVVEVDQSIFVIEAGLKYPDNDQHGIEMIIADVRYLVENKHRVKGIFVTHGHDDVMAAIANLVRQVNAPIYTAPLTALLIEDELKKNGISKVGLLGTKYTMTQEFYKSKLIEAGIEVVIPDEKGVEVVNDIIYNELCLGIIKEESKAKYVEIITELEKAGAQGVILGCTEIGLLVQQKDTKLPVFDTTQIHATKAAMMAIS